MKLDSALDMFGIDQIQPHQKGDDQRDDKEEKNQEDENQEDQGDKEEEWMKENLSNYN